MSKFINLYTTRVKDAPYAQTYQWSAVDFGAGDSVLTIPAPGRGFKGEIKDVLISSVTEAFTADTTEARIDLGIPSGDADAYGLTAGFGTQGIAPGAVRFALTKAADTVPAGNDIAVTCVAPTGGVPAGIADVEVTVLWYK